MVFWIDPEHAIEPYRKPLSKTRLDCSPFPRGKGLGVSFPLQPRIIILDANRIRIPLNVNIAAIGLLRLDHSRTITLATLPRREMVPALPLRHRRLPLQPPPRTINRGRNKDPPDQ